MMLLLLTAVFGASAFAEVCGVDSIIHCKAGTCLKAVRSRPSVGSADCSSYFFTTVTPAPSIVTITNTVFESSTSTESVTLTNTFYDTALETQRFTSFTEIPATTITVTSEDPDLRKRQETAIPTATPEYADVCGGSREYSSACLCIGVREKTTTLPQITITTQVDTTISLLRNATTTAATTDITITDATITILTTDATQTVTLDSTSTIFTRVPVPSAMAIKLTNVNTGAFFGYLYPGRSPRSDNYGGISQTPYRFFFNDVDGSLYSAYGRVGIEFYSDFHSGALRDTPSNFYLLSFTVSADGTFSDWRMVNGPYAGTLTTWYAPGASDQYTVFVNGNVPLSAPAGVGWTHVAYQAVYLPLSQF